MRLIRKRARALTDILEAERERIHTDPDRFVSALKGIPRTTLWERERKQVIERLRDLPTLVEKAATTLHVERGGGRKPALDPAQRTMLFLFARLSQRSNRYMAALLAFLGPVFGVEVDYKTIERMYSDEAVELVLHNLFVVLLEEAGVSGKTAGDGTGYALEAGAHYRSAPEKFDQGYRYVFRFVDLETGMYVAYGYSDVSEKAAFRKALRFVEGEELPLESVRLDKYYSSRKNLRELGEDVETVVLPKENLASFGTEWRQVFERIAADPAAYLDNYYQRELMESYFAADKERFGRELHQVREDRREMATAGLPVLHNLFSVRVTAE
jgi:transposase